jgi:hypothetical protein
MSFGRGSIEDKPADTGNAAALVAALKPLTKIKAKQWKEMGTAFKEMNTLMQEGGLSVERLFGGPIDIIKQQIETAITGAFAPIINEITSFIGFIIDEGGITDALEKAAGAFGNFIDALTDAYEDIEEKMPAGKKNIFEEGFQMFEDIFNSWAWLLRLFGMGKGGGGGGDDPPGGPQLPDPSTPGGPGHYLPDDQF